MIGQCKGCRPVSLAAHAPRELTELPSHPSRRPRRPGNGHVRRARPFCDGGVRCGRTASSWSAGRLVGWSGLADTPTRSFFEPERARSRPSVGRSSSLADHFRHRVNTPTTVFLECPNQGGLLSLATRIAHRASIGRGCSPCRPRPSRPVCHGPRTARTRKSDGGPSRPA